ncbi:dTDP-4-dehydrorhamnose 3,5-epimerase [Halomonas sp. LY9]
MVYKRLSIPDVVAITPKIFGDDRGFFMETFRQNEFEGYCGKNTFVQDNHSKSMRGVLRGLHFQTQKSQGKLIRVIEGKVLDVAVDLRPHSTHFGEWVSEILSDENKKQLWIPPNFAHGFLVLSDYAEVVYKTTEYYAPEYERSIMWNDGHLNINWRKDLWEWEGDPILSPKDKDAGSFTEYSKC